MYDFHTLWELPRSSVGAGKSGCVGNVLKKYHLHRCHRPPTLHLHHDQLRIGCLVGFSSYGGFKILLTSYANHLFVRKGCRLYILTWVRNFINEISVKKLVRLLSIICGHFQYLRLKQNVCYSCQITTLVSFK